jgi:hypothetical protein
MLNVPGATINRLLPSFSSIPPLLDEKNIEMFYTELLLMKRGCVLC